MITFLPYSNFAQCAKCLDVRRLGKQRVEARQIYDTILHAKSAWRNHPAVSMWRGFLSALALYHNAMIDEWILRGKTNNMPHLGTPDGAVMPWWLGDEHVHASHRASLFRKHPAYYASKFEVGKSYICRGYAWPKDGCIVFAEITQTPTPWAKSEMDMYTISDLKAKLRERNVILRGTVTKRSLYLLYKSNMGCPNSGTEKNQNVRLSMHTA